MRNTLLRLLSLPLLVACLAVLAWLDLAYAALCVYACATAGYHASRWLGWSADVSAWWGLYMGYLALVMQTYRLQYYLTHVCPGLAGLGWWLLQLLGATVTTLLVTRGAESVMTGFLHWNLLVVIICDVGIAAGGFPAAVWALGPARNLEDAHLQGGRLLPFPEAKALAERSGTEGLWFWWGGIRYPLEVALQHLITVATTGGGKSTHLYLFLKSVLPQVGVRPGWKALLFDGSGSLLDDLAGMGLGCRVVSLDAVNNALGLGWDIAADADTLDKARQVAAVFFRIGRQGKEDDNGRYFREACEDVVFGVIATLNHHAPRRWTLRHLVAILLDEDFTDHVLENAPEDIAGLRGVRIYFYQKSGEEKRSGSDVRSTIRTYMNRFATVAALWDAAAKRNGTVSITEWVTSSAGYCLVLGHDFRGESVQQPVNQVLLELAGQGLLAQEDAHPPDRMTFLVLDEAPLLGHVRILPTLLAFIRKKGGCVALTLQSINQFIAEYTEPVALTMGGLFNTWFIGKCRPETARWASEQYIGEAETGRWRPNVGHSSGGQGGGSEQEGWTWVKERELLVLPSEIARLPNTDRRNGLTAYAGSAHVGGTYRFHLPGCVLQETVWDHTTRKAMQHRVPWDDPDLQKLRPLDPDDWKILGLPPPARNRPAENTPAGQTPPPDSSDAGDTTAGGPFARVSTGNAAAGAGPGGVRRGNDARRGTPRLGPDKEAPTKRTRIKSFPGGTAA